MTARQRIVLWAWIALIALVVPPWRTGFGRAYRSVLPRSSARKLGPAARLRSAGSACGYSRTLKGHFYNLGTTRPNYPGKSLDAKGKLAHTCRLGTMLPTRG